MLTVGALSFAVPWALAALAALPLLWWLLRLTPPAPWLMQFPPVRLLLALTPTEETSAKSPLWLILLRIALAATLILAAAHPLFNAGSLLRGEGPLILIVDDGWAAAQNWAGRQAAVTNLIDQAEREGRAVVVATTAPAAADQASRRAPSMMTPTEARGVVESLQPKPWSTDREFALGPLIGFGGLTVDKPGHVVWLSDGLGGEAAADMAGKLKRLGAVTVVADAPEALARVLRPPVSEGGALVLRAVRADAGSENSGWVRALAEDGRPLAREALRFARGALDAEVRFALPTELRNRLTRLEMEDQATAAAAVLVDERWRRRPVGLVSAQGTVAEPQPLLGDLYYLERALAPFTEVRRGSVDELLQRRLAVMILVDPGPLETSERQGLESWIAEGGVAVRFAGPRLAQEADGLIPVRLRKGDRILGGAMSWIKPASLAPFKETSPFYGLRVPADIKVNRQVLAQPSVDLGDKTWAELSDGTPLVSAEKRGRGWLILVHTTANATWSNLSLSGLFVDMLRRFVALSQGVTGKAATAPLAPIEVMDGFGRLGPAPASVLAVAGDALERTVPGPRHPPGFYGKEDVRRALNLSAGLPDPQPIGILSAGILRESYGTSREMDLRPWLLVAAFVLTLIDLAASLALRGLLRLGPAAAAAAATALAMVLVAGDAGAQTSDEFRAGRQPGNPPGLRDHRQPGGRRNQPGRPLGHEHHRQPSDRGPIGGAHRHRPRDR